MRLLQGRVTPERYCAVLRRAVEQGMPLSRKQREMARALSTSPRLHGHRLQTITELRNERDALAAELAAVRERAQHAEKALRQTLDAYVAANDHITEDLQPEFEKLAATGTLSWPWNSTAYDQSRAAWRLATLWHGVGYDDLVTEARAALAVLSADTTGDK